MGQVLGLSRPETEVDWDAVAAVLDAEDEPNASDDEETADCLDDGSQALCQHRTGIVTELYDAHGYITSVTSGGDKERPLYFECKNAPKNLQIGNRVVYLAFRLPEDSDWIVRKVLYVNNELWDNRVADEEEAEADQSIVKEQCETAYKHVVCKVTGRDGRTVCAGNLHFSLDSVQIDFIPVEGDWLSLSSLVQSEAEGDTVLVVDQVSPLRSLTRVGRVCHWSPDEQLGIVGLDTRDGEVVFSKEVCEPGYLPKVGDQVTVYCIESEQGQLTWRAVQVVATVEKEIQSSQNPELAPLLQNKQGIVISENTNFGIISIGQEKQITIEVTNSGNTSQTLVAIDKSRQDSQFLLPPLPSPLPTTVQPGGSLNIIAKVKGRFVGRSSELLKFRFEEFEIGRQLGVDVQNSSLTSLGDNKNRTASKSKTELITGRKLLATRNGFVVPGVRPIKPASFVPVNLGMFNVPEKLVKLVLGTDKAPRKDEVIGQLLQDYRCVTEPLSGQNYVIRWDTLIHVEELEHMANISRYNTTAALHRVDEYLSLEIPGLAERRPSLMVGDRVFVRPSWVDENSWESDNNSVAYEGYIHKVLSNEVLLKFNPSFHDSCSGVYSVRFEGNRTSFRRLHQAVHVAFKNLTPEWLFPSRVDYQEPQVVIIEEENHVNPEGEPVGSSIAAGGGNKINYEIDSTATEILTLNCDKTTKNVDKLTKESEIEVDLDIKSSVETSINVPLSDNRNKEPVTKSSNTKIKRQKSKVSDMFDKLSPKEDNSQKLSPPRVPVVERFLQNGNCHSEEKSPQEVENILKQFMNLSCNSPKKKTEMKTLEEIEKSLLTPSGGAVCDRIRPLSGSQVVKESERPAVELNEKLNGSSKKQKINKEIRLNRSNKPQKEKNDKNNVNETTRQNQHDTIKWNSNIEMKIGNEKEALSKIPSWKKKKIRWFNPLLNHYQKEAVRNILKGEARPLPYVIFGPPGTGKTITVVEAVLQIYFLIPESRLLIATPSNSAADLVCERLLSCGLLAAGDLLRLCSFHYADQARVADSLRPYCGTADIKARDDQSFPTPSHVQEGVVNISRHAIGRHRVTVGTCGALAVLYQMGFPRGHFTHVVVDEAGQATEPEILIPLVFLHKSYGQAILAGDPLQLGPVVMSSVAEHFGLGESFLSRLLQRSLYCRDLIGYPTTRGYNPRLVTRLVYNYRSLPEILELPNNMFYDGDLVPKVSALSSEEAEVLGMLRSLLPTRQDQSPPALVFHGVRGTNCQATESPSWYNPHEAVQAALYLQSLYNAGLTPDQCGIITPYQAQVLKIRTLLDTLDVDLPKVGSVEEFQGQERMVVILSTVRSSPRLVETDLRHSVGFVASPRRLNVAITRARACLIVLGNPHLLARDHYWRTVLQYCVSHGGYTGCDLPADLQQAQY